MPLFNAEIFKVLYFMLFELKLPQPINYEFLISLKPKPIKHEKKFTCILSLFLGDFDRVFSTRNNDCGGRYAF